SARSAGRIATERASAALAVLQHVWLRATRVDAGLESASCSRSLSNAAPREMNPREGSEHGRRAFELVTPPAARKLQAASTWRPRPSSTEWQSSAKANGRTPVRRRAPPVGLT